MALPVRPLVLQKIGNLHWKVEVSFLLSIRLFREIRLFEGRCFCLQLLPFSCRQQPAAISPFVRPREPPHGRGFGVPGVLFRPQGIRVWNPSPRNPYHTGCHVQLLDTGGQSQQLGRNHHVLTRKLLMRPASAFASHVVQFCCYGGKEFKERKRESLRVSATICPFSFVHHATAHRGSAR